MPPDSLIRALSLGMVAGALVLGVVGRVAMRFYGWLDWQEPQFTPAGTMTVVGLRPGRRALRRRRGVRLVARIRGGPRLSIRLKPDAHE